jgi:hypothetical protein
LFSGPLFYSINTALVVQTFLPFYPISTHILLFMIYNLIMMHSCTSSSVLYNTKTTSELELDAMLMLMLISLYIDVVDIAVAVDVEDN